MLNFPVSLIKKNSINPSLLFFKLCSFSVFSKNPLFPLFSTKCSKNTLLPCFSGLTPLKEIPHCLIISGIQRAFIRVNKQLNKKSYNVLKRDNRRCC